MGDDNEKKKKIAVMGISSILLVAMVVAVAVGINNGPDKSGSGDGHGGISTTSKSVKVLCAPSIYKETCESSLAKSSENVTDPKKMVQVGFELAVESLKDAMKNSTTIKEVAEDPRAKRAVEICEDLIETAIDDLRRSLDELDNFDMSKAYIHIDNLKTWLEATITYQEVCRDEFENTTGPSGEKMKEILKLSGELTSNGLAMVSGLAQILKTLHIPGAAAAKDDGGDSGGGGGDGHHRRLLDSPAEDDGGFPRWVTPMQRRLLAATPEDVKPDIVVAQDGSGQFKSIMKAIQSIQKKHKVPIVMHVKAGVYKEHVLIPKYVTGLMMIGDGPTKTKVTGRENFHDGTRTSDTATFAILAPGFIAKDMGFENTAGAEGHQAVAYRSQSDNSVLYNCQFDGYQDTLYPQSNRQFYRNCVISGTIDFIFGVARTVLQNCTMIIRKPMENQACIVTAEGRKDPNGLSAIVIQNSRIKGDPAYVPVKDKNKGYLARPWKIYSRTVIMHSVIDGVIQPEGFLAWDKDLGLKTLYYAEYENTGAGSDTSGRVKWPGIKKIGAAEAEKFTPSKLFVEGDAWITDSGVPYIRGMEK
ncbi:Probable pectinesterase/pectinesterase inhibitor 21 [Linum grandiflorum]